MYSQDIFIRWEAILRSGLKKETKDEPLKKDLFLENVSS